MANISTDFFYWYRRYKVRAADMTGFQAALIDTIRGLSEGLLDTSVLKGLDVLPGASGVSVAVSGGIAVGASGYLQVVGGEVLDVSAAATGSLPTRSLVVARPFPTDVNFISSPTTPFNSVPLNSRQAASAIFLPGTPATAPEYPATGANDVILAGLIVPAGATGITSEMLDFEVRSIVGKTSKAGQNQLRADDRIRPFRVSSKVMGVKPSQDVGLGPKLFTYPGRLTPSVYPLDISGEFAAADSFYDFETGLVSGGDEATPAFTPAPASGNNSVVCSVTLHSDDTLAFTYGNEGTFAECVAAIRNQATGAGAGHLATQDGGFPVAFVVVSSYGGVVADIQVFDARGLGSAGTGGGGGTPFQGPLVGTVNGVNTDFLLPVFVGDQDDAIVSVDGLTVEKDEWQLVQISGSSYVRFLTGSIPQPGQSPYAFGTSVTGGGGGGGGGGAADVNTTATDIVIPTITNNYVLNANTTAGAIQVTLPSAVLCEGFTVNVKNIGSPANDVTLVTQGGQKIDFQSSAIISGSMDALTLVSDGADWFIY